MQKKILLSLLVASPTALPALANIDLGFGTWEYTGLTDIDKVDINYADKTVTGLLGAGKVVQTRDLKPGEYSLSFSSVKNLKIFISQNGEELVSTECKSGEFSVNFKVEKAGEIRIETDGMDANGYSFAGAKLELVADFTDLAATLQDALNNLPEYVEITDTTFPGAPELLTEKNVLEGTKGRYQTIVNQLAEENTPNETLEELYVEYKLYETPNILDNKIGQLGKDIDAWNEKADDLNVKIKNTEANTNTKKALLEEQQGLMTSIDALIEAIKAGPVYAEKQSDNRNLTKAEDLWKVIDNYANEINEAYADDKLAGVIVFTDRKTELEEKIAAIRGIWEGDVADDTAYQKFITTVYPTLQDAYNNGVSSLYGLQGISGYEDIYKGRIMEANTDIGKIFTEAKNNIKIKEIAGAAALIDAEEQNVKKAVEAIEQIVEDLKNLVETQNANATTGLKQVEDFTERYNGLTAENVPDQMKEEYVQRTAAIETAIGDLGTFVKENYTQFTLEVEAGTSVGDSYVEKVENITELLDGFETFMEFVKGINDLKEKFEETRKYVQDVSGSVDEYIKICALFNKPDGTFESIENAIDNLKTYDDYQAQKESIQDAIDDAKDTAKDLKNIFTELIAADKAYETAISGVETFVNDKFEIDANGNEADVLKKKFLADRFVQLSDAQKAFDAKLKDLQNGKTPQDIYNAAKSMDDELGDPYYWTPELEKAMRDFAQEVTASNNANLKTLKDNVQAFVEEGDYAGKDSISFDAIETAMSGIDTAIADADANTDNTEASTAYGNADNGIRGVVAQLKEIKAKATSYKQNQADYDALDAQLTDLQSKIDALTEKNNTESYDNGQEYFKGVIAGIQDQWDELKANLDAALENYADPDKNVTGQKASLEANVKSLGDLIAKTSTDIYNNNHYHNQQLEKAETVLQAIAEAFEQLEDYYTSPDGEKPQEGIEEWYNTTKDELTSLRDNDLFDNNVAVANAYGNGESYTKNDILDGEYNRILDEIAKITGSMLDDYTKAVVDANTATVEGAGWNATINAMNDQYRVSIEQFNAYYYGLTNQGWREYVLPIIKRHEEIYQYSQKINELIAEVTKYIKDKNTEPLVFTAEQFKEVATDKAQAMIDEMIQKVNTMNAEAAAAAEEYYAELHGEAQTQIDGYQAQLDNAGIVSNALDGVKGSLKDAEGKYTKATADTATQPLGIAMDRIADDLDKALAPIDLQPVAEQAWAAAYDDATKTVNNLLTALAANGDDYKFADEGLREQAIETITEILPEMSDLNTTVKGVTEGLINDYKGYKDQLDDLLNQAIEADKTVKDSSKNNLANQDLYKALTGTEIPGLEKDLRDLLDYADTLVGGQKFDGTPIEDKIEEFEQFVEDNAGGLTSKSTDIESYKTSIADAIETGYGQIGYYEQQYLNETLVPAVKVAFNDAKAAFMGAEGTTSTLEGQAGTDTVNEWNDKIDKLAEEVAALQVVNPFDKDAFREKAQALETALSDLYVEMEQTWTGDKHDGTNPVNAVLGSLENQYQEIADAIADARSFMEGCEEGLDTTPFADALDAEEAALEAQKEAWTAAGNRVLGMEKTYADAMDEIAAKVADTKAALEAANEQAIKDREAKEANEAAYADLSAQLDTIKSDLDRVAALAGEWYPGEYDGTIGNLRALLQATEGKLTDDYKEIKLNADSTLENGQVLTNEINALEFTLYNRKAKEGRQSAQSALVGVNTVLQGYLVPETRAELNNRLSTLYGAYNDNYDKQIQQGVTIEDLQAVIDEYQRIADEAATLKADAEEQVYVPGNVDLDPDGLVTAVDVQMMIRWVLDGTTWQELLAENPRQAYAADLNGDQDLNITDVTMDISWMFGENPNVQRVARFKAPVIDQNNGITLALVSEENGIRRYALMLDNTASMIAGQIDLKLPTGMRLVDITTTGRSANHLLESSENFDGVRVVLYSMENSAFEGNTGALLFIDVEGKGELSAQKVIFTDSYFQTHEMSKPEGTTFIDSIVDGAKNMGTRIYNAAGMMFDKLQNGLNIFRDKDGKVKKEYNRKK